MDALTIAALCTLILKGEAAVTAVSPGTNCSAIVAQARASAARASAHVQVDEDREGIARVAFAEAANQGDRGIAAVVFTIINRLGDGRWGDSVSEVLNARKQFEPVMRAGGDWRRLPPVPDGRRERVNAIVSLALRGDLIDETGGALYFQNPAIVAQRERAGLVSRGLTNFGGKRPIAVIGDHAFYAGEGGPRPRPRVTMPVEEGARPEEDQEQQRAFIDAGGALFAEGNGSAFDTPLKQSDRSPLPDNSDVDQADADNVAAPVTANTPPPSAKSDDDLGGGMFVLPSGRTSAAPPTT